MSQRLWTELVATFEGEYYQLSKARCEAKSVQKPHPPFVIGEGGAQLALKVAARYADIWTIIPRSVEDFARKSAILDGYCDQIRRSPADILRSVQKLANWESLEKLRIEARAYIEAGANHTVLELPHPTFPEMIQEVREQVVIPLKEGEAVG